ncbi:MAG: leucine-rich repeat domain-containing protein [Dysgonamonadaceae bacterium]|jgi:hypothetical protein|nr:leucine-rich repeat domain-containing protein [Dysgonamonadaceae bacterium]
MKKTKILLAILFCMSGFVSANAYDFVQGGIYYQFVVESSGVEVTYQDNNYQTYSGNVIIPASVAYSGKTYPVTAIGAMAFAYSNVTSVTIPSSIERIKDGAFYECNSLNSPTIPTSVSVLGDAAFLGCRSITSITLPEGIKKIGESAFFDCTKLASATFPSTVKSIGRNAFSNCKSLTSLALPTSVVSIGDDAFFGCDQLAIVSFPANIAQIGEGAFYGCTQLEAIPLPATIEKLGDGAFYGCSRLQSVSVPKTAKTIPFGAFANCSNLQEALLRNNLQTIGEYAFLGDNIGNMMIPVTVNSIKEGAFYANQKPMVVIVFWQTPLSVPTGDHSPFYAVDLSRSQLLVPKNTDADYRAAPVWQDFGSIIATYTGIKVVPETVHSYIADQRLYIDSSTAETISLYSLTGQQLRRFNKSEGKTNYPVEGIQDRVLIVKGSSGWAEKLIR